MATKPEPKHNVVEREKTPLILGLDPGYGRLGYGLIEDRKGNLSAITYGCFETPKTEDHGSRLLMIHDWLENFLGEWRPAVVGIETLFFSKNVKTALAVGEARGVLLVTAAKCEIPTAELSPQEVKLAVTGYGKADKKQIQAMTAKLLKLPKPPKPDDAADALALAIALAGKRSFFSKF
ncbi:MAG: crossover junction endodeoxyribonuclease RuvC [bacterium]|nr:crossover junction endodeoxyribonuclease RuvC [bacterium]